jgi:methionyl-tRNA formyltransferase
MSVLFLGPDCKPITDFLRELGHKVILCEEPIDVNFLDAAKPDFGVSYKYRHIVKKPVIDWFSGRLINLHISYLPWNRGADPNLWSFLTKTPSGVTIHVMDGGLDTGPILAQREVVHDLEKDTLESSYSRLSLAMENLFMEYFGAIIKGQILPRPQSKQKGSFHMLADKTQFEPFWAQKGWQTPLKEIWGKGVPHGQ